MEEGSYQIKLLKNRAMGSRSGDLFLTVSRFIMKVRAGGETNLQND